MAVATLCASHTPLMGLGPIDESLALRVDKSFARLADFVRNFDPELVIQFSPDHFNGFFYDLMPSFCLGAAANSVGDYDTQSGPLDVPEGIALELAQFVLEQDIDLAFSLRMSVDHGFTQIWEKMVGTARAYPLIPIFINCAAPPLPSYKRARLLGEAVGKWAAQCSRRILLVASGGLSHDPPLPQISNCPPEVRERLIAGRNPTPEARRLHVERVLAAGVAASKGEGQILPLNPAWDEMVLREFANGELIGFDAFDALAVSQVAGCGGNEIMAWVAALAAQSIAGAYDASVEFYAPIEGWIAGMGLLTANQRAGT